MAGVECHVLVSIPVNKHPLNIIDPLIVVVFFFFSAGAVYLEGGLEEARQLFGRLLFNSEVEHSPGSSIGAPPTPVGPAPLSVAGVSSSEVVLGGYR